MNLIDRVLPVPYFTALQLRKLRKIINSHQQILSESFSDTTEDYKHVYVLDFQEIYSYIFPYAVDADEAVIVEYVLDHIKSPFVLLSGTWIELVQKLQTIIENVTSVSSINSLLNNNDLDETASNFLREIFQGSRDDVVLNTIDFNTDLHQLSIDVATALAKYTLTFQRLVDLLNKPTHVKLSGLIAHPEELHFDQSILNKFKGALNELRPGSKSNYADAANLAGIVALRQYFNERSRKNKNEVMYKFYLLSHTATMLNLDTFATDEFGSAGNSLTRTPISVMYQVLLEKEDIEDTLEAINHRIDLCDAALKAVRHLATELATIKRKHEFFSGKLSDIRLSEQKEIVIKSEVLKQVDIKAFVDLVHDPVLDEINRIIQNDQVVQQNKNAKTNSGTETQTLNRQSDAIDELKKVLFTAASNKWLDEFNFIEKTLDQTEIDDRKYNRIRIRRQGTTDCLFSLDNYVKFYSTYWPTNRNLKQFYQVVKTSMEYLHDNLHDSNMAAREKFGNLKLLLLFATDKAQYNERIEIKELGMQSLEKKFDLSENEVGVFIRVATPWGDFCYDIIPVATDRSTYMGFVGKYQLTSFVSELVFTTTTEPMLLPNFLFDHLKADMGIYPETISESYVDGV